MRKRAFRNLTVLEKDYELCCVSAHPRFLIVQGGDADLPPADVDERVHGVADSVPERKRNGCLWTEAERMALWANQDWALPVTPRQSRGTSKREETLHATICRLQRVCNNQSLFNFILMRVVKVLFREAAVWLRSLPR